MVEAETTIGNSHRINITKIAFYFIAIWNPLQYFFTRHLGVLPLYARWFDDAAVLLLAIFATIKILKTRGKSPRLLSFFLVFSFLTLAIISSIANEISMNEFIAGLRPQLMYIVFFYSIIILDYSEKTLKTFFALSTIMALVQLPVGLYQFIQRGVGVFNPDFVFGTFAMGWANILSHYLLIFVFIFLGLAVNKSKYRSGYVLMVILLVFGLILTGGRASIFFLLIGTAIIFRNNLLNKKVLSSLIIFVVVTIIFLNFYYNQRPITLQTELNLKGLLSEQLNHLTSPGRLHYLFYTWELIQQNWGSFLWGFGPASYASTAGSALNARLLLQATEGAYSPFIQSQIVAVLGEYGLLGTVLLFAIHIHSMLGLLRFGKVLKSKFWGGVYKGFIALSCYYIFLGVWVEKIWETQPIPYYYWFFAASLYLMSKQELRKC